MLSIGSVALVCSGCFGGAEREAGSFWDLPLPYSVGVFFDSSGSSLPGPTDEGASPDGASPTGAPRFEKSGQEIAADLAVALTEDYDLVSRAVVITAESPRQALEAAKNLDFLVSVAVKAPEDYSETSHPASMIALEVPLWLFGLFSSWFVPSVSYETDTELTVRVVDINHGSFRRGQAQGRGATESSSSSPSVLEGRASSERSSLSLWDRSDLTEDPADYALSILMPPMFIQPEDHDLESAALTESVLDDLHEQVMESLQKAFREFETKSALRVKFQSPRPGAKLSGMLPELRIGIASRGGVAIQALDVNRLGNGVAPFRWRAGADELSAWNAELSSEKPHRVFFTLPERLPLVSGKNLVKVRIARADGEMVTRTVVYEYVQEE